MRHKLSDDLLFSGDNRCKAYWVRREKTLCGIPVDIPGIDLSVTSVGEFDCEDCKAEYALQLLADLP